MANTYPTLGNGSSGSEVKKLQEALMAAGYNVGSTGADGIYGNNTAAAVRKYQQDNGLAVDGVAGQNTLGKLYSTPAPAPAPTPSPSPAPAAPKEETPVDPSKPTKDSSYTDFTYDAYKESDVVQQANALLQQQIASKPGAYQSQWDSQINDYMNQIQNRDPFSYDFNTDALYQQYKDQYIQQGQMAMMDTMGQAAAMTGGYGNSFAQTAGQQAYNQQLNNINNMIPQLYEMSLNRYNQEGQDLLNQYNMLLDRESQDYGRYVDSLNAWQSERDYLAGRYDAERDRDYSKWEQERDLAYDQWASSLGLEYQKHRDEVSDKQWQTEYDESVRQYNEQMAAAKAKSVSGGNGPGTQTKDYKNLTLDDWQTINGMVAGAEDVGELQSQARILESMGYDPAIIEDVVAKRYDELMEDNSGTPTGVTSTVQNKNSGGKNSGIKHYLY